jgi:hypothetical protein
LKLPNPELHIQDGEGNPIKKRLSIFEGDKYVDIPTRINGIFDLFDHKGSLKRTLALD